MRTILSVFLFTTILPSAAAAQVSPEQMCVWACLRGPGNNDATSQAYAACLEERQCESAGSDPTEDWQRGQTQSGMRYAGVDAPGQQGARGMYYFCDGGEGHLSFVGLDAPVRPLELILDGEAAPLDLSADDRGHWRAPLSPGAPLLERLGAAAVIEIRLPDGTTLWQLSPSGASAALAWVASGC